ncbi:MAG: hypothetical protein HY359_05645 [Candidatus Rokubacteria bacterium]|nr:hypothetical protein [Candidatus Rokubacteria bacterium]
MGAPPLRLRVLLYPEAGEWIAHCLELDLVETADSPDAAVDALIEAVQTQVSYVEVHDNAAALFHPAPADAWARFGTLLSGDQRPLVRRVPDPSLDVTLEVLRAA